MVLGVQLFDLDDKRTFTFTLAALLLVYSFLRRLLFSPFVRWRAYGQRASYARALGFSTFSYKLTAHHGWCACWSGRLSVGVQTGYVNP